jgi:hypothetical protein
VVEADGPEAYGLCHHRSEHQYLFGSRGCGKLVHGAGTRTVQEIGTGQTARIHAGAAQQDLTFARQHPPQHPLDVVVAVWRLLARPRGNHGVGHQEDGDFGFRLLLDEGAGKAQRVVAALAAKGWSLSMNKIFMGEIRR